jgi:zinc protease
MATPSFAESPSGMSTLSRFARLAALAALCWLPLTAGASPDIVHWTTPNGARVYFVERHELPIVDLRVVFDAGSARDAGKPGLACLTNALLSEGSGDLDADAIAEGFTHLGAEFDLDCARDMATAELRSLSQEETLDDAVELFSSVLREPTFAAEDFARVQDHTLQLLRQHQQRPEKVAERAFYRAIYGDHPYAGMPRGEIQSVSQLTRDDVAEFHRYWYGASNAVIALVGDLTPEHAHRLVSNLIGCLPGCEPAPALPAPEPLAQAKQVGIDFPSSQSHVLMGQLGVRRGDPDWYALYLGNHILGGGGLVSRLSEQVRAQRGLSYSVYSFFQPMHVEGLFQIGLQTRNDQRDEAMQVAADTLRRFLQSGPDPEELEDAKRNITGGFPLRIDSNKKISRYLAMIGFYKLPLSYLDTFPEKIEAQSAEAVRDAFRRRIHPQRLATVVVGAPDAGGDGGSSVSAAAADD